MAYVHIYYFFFFNDTATTEIYTLSLHDALPISEVATVHSRLVDVDENLRADRTDEDKERLISVANPIYVAVYLDRKSTRLNSSHLVISYAVFCLKKKKRKLIPDMDQAKSASYLR